MTKIFACSLTAGNPSLSFLQLYLLLRKEQIMTENEIRDTEYKCFGTADGQSTRQRINTLKYANTHSMTTSFILSAVFTIQIANTQKHKHTINVTNMVFLEIS